MTRFDGAYQTRIKTPNLLYQMCIKTRPHFIRAHISMSPHILIHSHMLIYSHTPSTRIPHLLAYIYWNMPGGNSKIISVILSLLLIYSRLLIYYSHLKTYYQTEYQKIDTAFDTPFSQVSSATFDGVW